eukprot:GHVU01143489.1.p1 GENE.GHVU01143489.1~~GHVU01143489.1.p1  ORF type:complete len:265 (+),score=28.90 GHVU01143489.1:252-1046(+)
MLSAFRDLGVVNCVDHLMKNIVDRTVTKKPFARPLKASRANSAHIRSGMLTQTEFSELQQLLHGRPKKPVKFCSTRWLIWHSLTKFTVESFSALAAYQLQPIPGRRTAAETKKLRDAIGLTEEDDEILNDLQPVLEMLKIFNEIVQATKTPTSQLLWPMLASMVDQLNELAIEGIKDSDDNVIRELLPEVRAAVRDLVTDIKKSFTWSEGTNFTHLLLYPFAPLTLFTFTPLTFAPFLICLLPLVTLYSFIPCIHLIRDTININ